MATRQEVSDFLDDVKVAIELGRTFWKGQPKTDQGLIDLNLTRNQALKIVAQLTIHCYSSGPVPDDSDQAKDVWIFGCAVDAKETYIKLRLDESLRQKDQKRLVIWSFHPAEHAMKYPYKEKV